MDPAVRRICKQLGVPVDVSVADSFRPGVDYKGVFDLDGHGRLYCCSFYPSVHLVAVLQSGWLLTPRTCVQCGGPIAECIRLRETRNSLDFRPACLRRSAWVGLCAEHIHSKPQFRFLVSGHDQMIFSRCEAYCPRKEFLEDLIQLNRRHELFPPWVVFAGKDPDLGWNQGTAQEWRLLAWEPFWAKLGADERRSYLYRWGAPEDWEEYLTRGP